MDDTELERMTHAIGLQVEAFLRDDAPDQRSLSPFIREAIEVSYPEFKVGEVIVQKKSECEYECHVSLSRRQTLISFSVRSDV